MKANDIMIGDYFRIAQTGKIIKIVAVDEPSGSVDYFDGDAGGVLTIGVEKIEPIPLTAEILEKNGWNVPQAKIWWECFNVSFWLRQYVDGRFEIMTDEDSDCIFTTIRYVHELQHALRLCGIDKEIVL